MSKFVALAVVAVAFALGAPQTASAGQPNPLCWSFWSEEFKDPFGCKAACAATPAAAPACPEPAPAAAPAAAPANPPPTDEAPPAPTTARHTPGQQRSFSYDPSPAAQATVARSSSRPAARPVNLFRADRKMRGL